MKGKEGRKKGKGKGRRGEGRNGETYNTRI